MPEGLLEGSRREDKNARENFRIVGKVKKALHKRALSSGEIHFITKCN
jgi:hypothetical protein